MQSNISNSQTQSDSDLKSRLKSHAKSISEGQSSQSDGLALRSESHLESMSESRQSSRTQSFVSIKQSSSDILKAAKETMK